jgi:hypothetical protein
MGVNIMWKTASFLSLYGGGLFSIGQLCTFSNSDSSSNQLFVICSNLLWLIYAGAVNLRGNEFMWPWFASGVVLLVAGTSSTIYLHRRSKRIQIPQ